MLKFFFFKNQAQGKLSNNYPNHGYCDTNGWYRRSSSALCLDSWVSTFEKMMFTLATVVTEFDFSLLKRVNDVM